MANWPIKDCSRQLSYPQSSSANNTFVRLGRRSLWIGFTTINTNEKVQFFLNPLGNAFYSFHSPEGGSFHPSIKELSTFSIWPLSTGRVGNHLTLNVSIAITWIAYQTQLYTCIFTKECTFTYTEIYTCIHNYSTLGSSYIIYSLIGSCFPPRNWWNNSEEAPSLWFPYFRVALRRYW